MGGRMFGVPEPYFDDYDFQTWIMAMVEDAGARWIVPAVPEFEYTAHVGDDGETIGLGLTNHYVSFEDTSKLKIEFQAVRTSATSTWAYGHYSYHYIGRFGFVFRYDKHSEPWFEKKYGTDCHVHDGHPKSRRHMYPTPPVELDTVMDAAIAFQNTGAFVRI